MMDYPLTVRTIYQRALTLFPDKQLVTRRPEGVRRTTYGEWAERVARLAGGLRDLGVGPGDRVGDVLLEPPPPPGGVLRGALMGARSTPSTCGCRRTTSPTWSTTPATRC